MAPFMSDETAVDVFAVPHSRMKMLVDGYSEKLQATDFLDVRGMHTLLAILHETFREFKMHEQIENRFILTKLKSKLKKHSVKNQAVCNCHKDNRLTEMLDVIEDGYRKKTAEDRINYGLQLRRSLEDFTDTFIPHMQEEEEVFQPLLEKYLSTEELKELKLKVIQEHSDSRWWENYQGKVECNNAVIAEESDEDICEESNIDAKGTVVPSGVTVNDLPEEVLLKIFSHLEPPVLTRCAQVSQAWNSLAYDTSLWRDLYPVKWAQGLWSYKHTGDGTEEEEEVEALEEVEEYLTMDEDADRDESDESEMSSEANEVYMQLQRESKILNGLVKYVLPSAGLGVRHLSLGNSRALTNGKLKKILEYCPNLEHLDISQTRVSDVAFNRLLKTGGLSYLKRLIFSGCQNIMDGTFVQLARSSRLAGGESAADVCDRGHCCCLQNGSDPEGDTAEGHDQYLNKNSEGTKDLQSLNNERMKPNTSGSPASGCHTACDTVNKRQTKPSLRNIEDCASISWEAAKNVMDKNVLPPAGQVADYNGPGKLVLPSVVREKKYSESSDSSGVGSIGECYTRLSDQLEYLNLSGCYNVTDSGIRELAKAGPYPNLRHLDLSGCYQLTSEALTVLVSVCPSLPPEGLYYCDNIMGGPYEETANGCRNLECDSRACCRLGV